MKTKTNTNKGTKGTKAQNASQAKNAKASPKGKAKAAKAAAPKATRTRHEFPYSDEQKIVVLNKEHGMRGNRAKLMDHVLKSKTVAQAKDGTVGQYRTGTLYIREGLERGLIRIGK